MTDFGKSDRMIKISGKVDKPNTYNQSRRKKTLNLNLLNSFLKLILRCSLLVRTIYVNIYICSVQYRLQFRVSA